MSTGIFIPLSRLVFLFSSLAIYLSLPSLLASEQWGDLAVVLGFYGWLSTSLAEAAAQFISRGESEAAGGGATLLPQALRLCLPAALIISGAMYLLAPLVAELYRDKELSRLLSLGAVLPGSQLLIGVLLGLCNGRKNFFAQASISSSLAVLRAVGSICAAWLGWGAAGALGAVVAASVFLALSATAFLCGRGKKGTAGQQLPSTCGFFTLWAFIAASRLLYYQDLFWLKRLAFIESSKVLAGAYLAVSNLALAPFFLASSMLWLILPELRTERENRAELTEKIRQGLRWVLLSVAAGECLLAANPDIISMLYPTQPLFRLQGDALTLLSLSNIFLALFVVSAGLLNSSGWSSRVLWLLLLMLSLQAVGCRVLVPLFWGTGAALASLLANTFGAASAGWLLCRRFGPSLPWLSFLRVFAAAGSAFAVGRIVELEVVEELLLCGALFAAVTWFSGELRFAEVRAALQRHG